MYPWKKEVIQDKFGNLQHINTQLQEEYNLILGVMSELLIRRLVNKDKLFNYFKVVSNEEHNEYTDDEQVLSCMHDIKYKYHNSDEYFETYKNDFDKNPKLRYEIKKILLENKYAINSIFRSQKFKKDLESFLSNEDNENLKTDSIWNVTLFYNQFTQQIYRPAIHHFFDYFNEDISILHENINLFINKYITSNIINFEVDMNLEGRLSDRDMNILNQDLKDNRLRSIVGRCDIYDSLNKNLFEIKTSQIKGYSNKWLTQTVMYKIMFNIVYKDTVENIFIVNLLNGNLWKWKCEFKNESIEKVVKKIGKKYDWHKVEINALIEGINNM